MELSCCSFSARRRWHSTRAALQGLVAARLALAEGVAEGVVGGAGGWELDGLVLLVLVEVRLELVRLEEDCVGRDGVRGVVLDGEPEGVGGGAAATRQ